MSVVIFYLCYECLMFCICRYGFFWICLILVFVMVFLGNLVVYLFYKLKIIGGYWYYDINLMFSVVLVFYGYVGLVFLVLYFLLRYLGVILGVF